METLSVLEKTLAEITRRNWHGGSGLFGLSSLCQLCLGGRIASTALEGRQWEPNIPPVEAVVSVIHEMAVPRVLLAETGREDPTPGNVISWFNWGATFEEVTDVLKRAIRTEKAKAGTPLDIPAQRNQDLTKQEEPA